MKKLIAIYMFLVVSSSAFAATGELAVNFHEVDQGRLYRSAQLTGKQLGQFIKKYRIQTVINLRGYNPSQQWYREELAASNKNGVEHFDIAMSAKAIPHRDNLLMLLDLYKKAPRPILIHCQAGADRTGEAAAIYQMIYQRKSKEQALKQLSLKYHHVQKFAPAKRYFIEKIWQNENWAYNQYFPCDENYPYYNKNNPECSP